MSDTPVPGPIPADEKATPYRWYVVAILVGVYMLHHLDRVVLSLLQEPIKHEFHLSDSQLALVNGTAYAIAFGLAGLPLGFLADRVHRVRMLAILMTVWSGLTALGSTASTYMTLFLIRIGVGAAESGGTPTNLSIIGDYFSKSKRSTAVGFYLMGSQLGTLIGFAVTGLVASHYGWRTALLVAGIPGLCLMLVVLLTIREPQRTAKTTLSPVAAFKAIGSNAALVHIIAATTIANVVAPGLSQWLPSLLIRSEGVEIGKVGLIIAFSIAPIGMLGTILAGMVTEKISPRHPQVMLRLMALAAFMYIPAIWFGVLSHNPYLTIAGFGAQLLMHMLVSTPGYAMSLQMVPANVRGTAAALLQVLSNLIGFGVGPVVGGALSDAFQPQFGNDSLRWAMGVFVLLTLWPMFHHLRAAALLGRQIKASGSVTGGVSHE